MQLQTDVPLAPLTTFRMGPRSRYFINISDVGELPEAFAFARDKGLPCFVLGGGSNTIFTTSDVYNGVVLKISFRGFEVSEDETGAYVRIGAGEDWDAVVARAVELGLSGIEALSAIPGSAGATPVQNVGAYGTEIADVLTSIEVFDPATEELRTLSREDCGFSYRDSRFKHREALVITAITLRLSRREPAVPDYPGVRAYFDDHSIKNPSLLDIREAIISIRKTKLPDPKDVASVGSFFKNPFVSREVVERLRSEFEKPVIFEQTDGRYKVGAGWLIEMLGLKGTKHGHLGFYEHNALVLTNDGQSTYAELNKLVREVQHKISSRFGIMLETEPTYI